MLPKLVGHFTSLIRRLLELRDTPHAIAGGVAIGVFFGFTPLFGLKTLLALATAWLARCSKLAAVIAVTLHDVVTPLWPILLTIEYNIGYWLLSHPHRLPAKIHLDHHHMHISEMLKWTTFLNIGAPLLAGSVMLAVPIAFVCYAVAFAFFRKRRGELLPPTA